MLSIKLDLSGAGVSFLFAAINRCQIYDVIQDRRAREQIQWRIF
jgi:hypothetical protein